MRQSQRKAQQQVKGENEEEDSADDDESEDEDGSDSDSQIHPMSQQLTDSFEEEEQQQVRTLSQQETETESESESDDNEASERVEQDELLQQQHSNKELIQHLAQQRHETMVVGNTIESKGDWASSGQKLVKNVIRVAKPSDGERRHQRKSINISEEEHSVSSIGEDQVESSGNFSSYQFKKIHDSPKSGRYSARGESDTERESSFSESSPPFL